LEKIENNKTFFKELFVRIKLLKPFETTLSLNALLMILSKFRKNLILTKLL
jgi:hypothetical protein